MIVVTECCTYYAVNMACLTNLEKIMNGSKHKLIHEWTVHEESPSATTVLNNIQN